MVKMQLTLLMPPNGAADKPVRYTWYVNTHLTDGVDW
jgi:hypothetical protein